MPPTEDLLVPDRDLVALSSSLRLSCMRISRRVRFESGHELTPSQFSVLARLELGPLTNGELAEIEKVSAPSMLRTTASVVSAGLASRHDDPADGRRVLLHLTPEGAAALERIRRHRDEWMLERLSRLAPEELAALKAASDLLAKVAAE